MDDIRPKNRLKRPASLPQPPLTQRPNYVKPVAAVPPKQQTESILQSIELPHINPVKPAKKRKIINWIAGIIIVGILASLTAAAAAYFWYQAALKPVADKYAQVEVQIPSGASVGDSAKILEQAGVVKSSLATQLYMSFTKKTSIKAGHYLLSPNQTVAQIADWLNEGRVDTFVITILPGKTIIDLREQFLGYGYSEQEVDRAFAAKYDYEVFADKPANTSLEGYIYPDTYFAQSTDPLETVLEKSFAEFDRLVTENNIKTKLAAQGFNLYQGITLGSIIYKEVHVPEDMRKVSQVFSKRLTEGMPLGSDVTFIYGAKLLGVPESPSLDSPYNTRIHVGLPPGPISNFNVSVLEAVANPSNTEYLYFVAGDDGVTRFSFSVDEHERNVQLYCRKLCGLDN